MEEYQDKAAKAIQALAKSVDGLCLVSGHSIFYEYVSDPEKIAFVEQNDPTTQGYLIRENDQITFCIDYVMGDERDALLEKVVTEEEARDICITVLSLGGYIEDSETGIIIQ
jgi:hypothetical protein